MTGKVLNNRYELMEKIGSGGMADVYKAKCRVLKRWVAVKILKDEFVNDEEFLERFEREAYAAGSLNHPNIVSIYDVGRDDSIHYIVMEYIDGITLKDYIRQNGALSWQEASEIAISILSALHKAHRHNIVHRDIKPQNILMTSDDVPKVTDFGIARAASTATTTQKIDTVGSVHYASPEQARGGYTDEKSDLYSVGVTLFEMVTGRVPFDADNPVTVALKQIDEEPAKPSLFTPNLPSAMDNIILRAMKKSKNDRYDSALQMIAELDHLKKGESLEKEPVNQTDPFATRVIGSLEEEKLAGKRVKNQRKKSNKRERNDRPERKKYVTAITYIVLIGLIFGGLWLVYDGIIKDFVQALMTPKVTPVEVINYVGMDIEAAITDMTEKDIPYTDPVYEYDETAAKGIIIFQKPAPGIKIMPGQEALTRVELVVSNGLEEVIIPEDIKFRDYLEAEILLRDELKLKPKEFTEYSDEVAQGRVTRTEPAIGSTVKVGTVINLYKSLGPELKDVIVPDLTNDTMDEAKHKLLSLNLSIGRIYPEGREGYKGRIVNQEPKTGQIVKEMTAINIYFQDKETPESGDGSGDGVTIPGDGRVSEKITLPEGVSFGDTIELVVYAMPSDTGMETLLRKAVMKKSEFPITILVPVSPGVKTTLKIYMDNHLQYQKEVFSRE